MNPILNAAQKEYLRDLAKRQREAAELPQMAERRAAWIEHNRATSRRTMVVMEESTFWRDIRPAPRLENGCGAWLEDLMLRYLFVHEQIGDDKVVPVHIPIALGIRDDLFRIPIQTTQASEGVGFHIDPAIVDLEQEVDRFEPSDFGYDEAGTRALAEWVAETVGDILPPRLENATNRWSCGLSYKAIRLLGMENLFVAMKTEPQAVHRLMRRLTDDRIAFLRWQEANGLILPNNGNDYMGSGSYCFSDELPGDPERADRPGEFPGQRGRRPVTSRQTWGHLNSQESVGISPETYGEFVAPYYHELARQFGLVYYGCCEPVDPFWDAGISDLPNLRKVSISAWCDEARMAEQLAGRKIIYSRKPSPNYLGVESAFDEKAFRASIRETMRLTRDLPREVIFRDIYRLHGNLGKVRRAVEIVREEAG